MPAVKRKAAAVEGTHKQWRHKSKEQTCDSKMLGLPNEIILAVADFLPRRDLHHLCLGNQRLLSLLQRILYARDTAGDFSESLLWSAIHNRPATAAKSILAGAKVDGWKPKPDEHNQIHFNQELLRRDPCYGARARVPLARCDQSPLFIACFLGHFDVTRMLLSHGAAADWTTPWERFMTPATAAAAKGHLKILQYLHESGYNFNQSQCYHGTILHCAASHARAKVVEFLVKTGRVDIGAKNKDGITALSKSVAGESVTVFQYLLKHTPPKDASVTAALRLTMDQYVGSYTRIILDSGKLNWHDLDEYGDTVVGRAIRRGQSGHVSLFVQHSDFDPNLKSVAGLTPLMQAKQFLGDCGRPLKILLESDKISESDKFSVGEEVYSDAVRRSNCDDLLKLLLAKGFAGNDHASHFHKAVKHGQIRIAHLLVDKYAVPVDCMTPNGHTAVQVAFLSQDSDMVRKLCELGAVTTVMGHSNLPLLHCAARDGPVGMIRALLVGDADPNLRTQDSGETALHFACAKGNMDRITTLLANGADPMIYDMGGRSPYHLAARAGTEKLVKWLLSGRSHPDPLLQDGLTLLHEACRGRNVPVVKFLLKRRANIESQTDDGETPLHTAIASGDVNVVRLLLNHGADIFAEAKDKSTPASLAATLVEPPPKLFRGGERKIDPESENTKVREAVQKRMDELGMSPRQK